ncbi:MAG TPA: hypothetical protein VN648_22135, partial [Candidatus Methylomirabilis sp.]|nr:hypothetical protein [Candidatus Methylomirabilis sp.]
NRHGDAELEAHSLLARALVEGGKLSEARKEIDQAALLAGKAQNRAARLEFSIVAAQVRSASGKASDVVEAEKSLQTVLVEAERNGFLGYQLEARLALATIQFKAGRAPGSKVLAALQTEAEAKGFGLIARKAAATAGGRV